MFQKYEDIERFGHVHHIDGNRNNNNLENLLLLCPSCHKKADSERRKNKRKSNKNHLYVFYFLENILNQFYINNLNKLNN